MPRDPHPTLVGHLPLRLLRGAAAAGGNLAGADVAVLVQPDPCV